MSTPATRYRRHRFPPQIISHSVWLYHRFSLSFRDVEDLLAQRGIEVSYESIRRWCLKFGPGMPPEPSDASRASAIRGISMRSS